MSTKEEMAAGGGPWGPAIAAQQSTPKHKSPQSSPPDDVVVVDKKKKVKPEQKPEQQTEHAISNLVEQVRDFPNLCLLYRFCAGCVIESSVELASVWNVKKMKQHFGDKMHEMLFVDVNLSTEPTSSIHQWVPAQFMNVILHALRETKMNVTVEFILNNDKLFDHFQTYVKNFNKLTYSSFLRGKSRDEQLIERFELAGLRSKVIAALREVAMDYSYEE